MANLPKIIDNNRQSLLDSFRNIASNHDHLSIATGYWDLKGMQEVFDFIKGYKKIRLLIGREPLIPRHKEFRPEPDYPDKDFFYDLEQMQPTDDLKKLVQSIKKLINDGALEVRVYRKNFLHAKCYIFGDYSSDNAIGIIGSSNFTKNGLTHNTELNALESDHRIVTYKPQSEKQEVGHLFWFDQFWDDPDTEEWGGQFTELLEQSPVGDTLFSPYETYIKTLHDLYNEELIEEDIDQSIKGSHELMDFQIKNVHALLRRLRKYKVAMLADSVGLGKTYTAIEVIKQYLTGEEGLRRVEIICPKSLTAQWSNELATQGVFNLAPLTLQNPRQLDEKRKLDDIASVSLFVIDESHNLKNRAGKRFQQIIEWMRANPGAHVLLLTATPINNQLSDIVNQILIGTRGESNILKVTTVDKRKQTVQIDFYQAIENLQKKIKQDIKRDGSFDEQYVQQIMGPILRAFVVRRTRQGIEREYGCLNIDGTERHFPVATPEVKRYGFDSDVVKEIRSLENEALGLDRIYKLSSEEIVENTKNLLHPMDQLDDLEEKYTEEDLKNISPIHYVYQIVLLLGLVPYRWKMYQTKYYGKTRKQVKEMKISASESKTLFLQLSIYGILRTMFLKRMESSVSAIRSSLQTYKRKIAVFERGLDIGKIVSLKDLSNIEEQLMLGDEDFDPDEVVLEEEAELDTVDPQRYVLEELRADLEKEKYLIDILDKQLAILGKDDSKITAFVELLKTLNKDKPAGSKVLVFSFYADTIEYLKEELPKRFKDLNDDNSAFLSSKNRGDADVIAGRFSPKAKKYTLKEGESELNYLFSTDILSEGQNLQDCGILVNYDLHWNPVRMIQRNGRINRIGTEYDEVFIYNISPEDRLEEYLRLVERLEGKINLIRNTIGTDTPVLDETENPIEFTDSWKDIYSDSLQKRIEAIQQAEKDADFLLSEDEYISDLKVFNSREDVSEKYKNQIYNIPRGKWALMPQMTHKGDQRPDLLVLSALNDEDCKNVGHAFVLMKRDGTAFQAATHLQALEWLKAGMDDNERPDDKISVDKIKISKKTDSSVEAYLEEEEVGAPIGQQTEVLRIMYEQHCTEEDIERVESAFRTTNVLDKQEIRKLVRKIMKSKKENGGFVNYINELIEISENTMNTKEKDMKYDHVQQILFYVNKNE
jgi:superfamily II DNA or RNA helicase